MSARTYCILLSAMATWDGDVFKMATSDGQDELHR